MNKPTQAIRNDLSQLAEDTHALIGATADATSEKVGEARKRLAAALEHTKEVYDRVRDKAVVGVKTTDAAVHRHPYQAIGIALGVGALIGYLVTRRSSHHDD